MANNFDYASLPSGFRMKLNELDQHPYWGDEFAAGDMEYLLFEKENGGYVALITSGSWDGFEHTSRGITTFHTQTGARTHGRVLGFINKDTDVSQFGITKKVATWTLK